MTCPVDTGRGAVSFLDEPGAAPLRVCFIGHGLYGLLYPSSSYPFGGAEVQLWTLARALARQGLQVCLLTGDGRRTGRDEIDGVTIVLDPLIGGFLRAGAEEAGQEPARGPLARYVHERLNQSPPLLARAVRGTVRSLYACRRWLAALPYVAPLIRRVRNAVRERQRTRQWDAVFGGIQADVYVARCAGEDVGYIQRACRRLRRKFVYMVASEMDVSGEYARSNGRDGILFERGLREADLVICQHEEQVALLRAVYGKQGRLMRSLCPVPPRNGRRQSERHTVLWVGRLEPCKQPERLLELARRLPEETFVMVAPVTHLNREYAARIAREACALPNLRLVPGVPFGEITALFEEAKVFVNTSQYEGFPNTFLQAAACGTPIVSWSVNPEGVLERYQMGWCAQQDDAAFEAFVRRACTTPSLREDAGKQGRRYVARFHDPVCLAGDYAQLFRALAAKEPGPLLGRAGRVSCLAGSADA